MVRQQDAEYDATKSHILTNVYRRVQLLGSSSSSKTNNTKKRKNKLFLPSYAIKASEQKVTNKEEEEEEAEENIGGGGGMLTYIQMRRCLLRLGIGWKRSYFPTVKEEDKITEDDDNDDNNDEENCPFLYDDDDVSMLSFNSNISGGLFSTAGSNNSSSAGAGGGAVGGGDIIVSDAQLIMLLVTLVEMEERHRAISMTTTTMSGSSSSGSFCVSKKNDIQKQQQQHQGLYLPDFILAYKLIIGGMQCIKSVNKDTLYFLSNDDEAESRKHVKLALCNRLKERTLAMLQPFGPNCQMYNDILDDDDDDASCHSNPSKRRSRNDALLSSSEQGTSSLRDNIKKGGESIIITEHQQNQTLPMKKSKLVHSKDMMKKVMRSKDVTLARIVEEHELEMENVSCQLETLRLEELQMRRSFQKRRMQIILLAILAGCGVLSTGILLEKRYRHYLEQELLLTEREKERRMVDARTIELLQEKKMELEEKLHVMEGKMRYQVDRTKDMDSKVMEITEQMNDVDMKWLFDKVEMERCQSSQVELSEILKMEQTKNEDGNEELVWCRNRLHSQERELNELEHVSGSDTMRTWVGGVQDDNISKKGQFSIAISKRSGGDSVDSVMRGLHQQYRPVYLEMKYNKSIRNIMLLRQTYSAIAGVAVSAILHRVMGAWMPTAAVKNLGPALSSPHAAEVILRRAEKVVDGIFGSSVAFLLIRAVVAFVSAL